MMSHYKLSMLLISLKDSSVMAARALFVLYSKTTTISIIATINIIPKIRTLEVGMKNRQLITMNLSIFS